MIYSQFITHILHIHYSSKFCWLITFKISRNPITFHQLHHSHSCLSRHYSCLGWFSSIPTCHSTSNLLSHGIFPTWQVNCLKQVIYFLKGFQWLPVSLSVKAKVRKMAKKMQHSQVSNYLLLFHCMVACLLFLKNTACSFIRISALSLSLTWNFLLPDSKWLTPHLL